MTGKMKGCFTGHVLTHSVVGLGLGLLLASLMPSLANLWIGLVLIVVAVVYDKMGK